MAQPVFNLPVRPSGSWTWPIKRTPKFATITQTPASLRGQLRVSLSPYPIWEWSLDLAYVKGNLPTNSSAAAELIGFYLAMNGSAGSFLYADPFDNAVTGAVFGTGDGTKVAFPLQRQMWSGSGFSGWDLMQNVNGTPNIYVNGTLTTPSSISATGLVTFSAAPASGASLTWTGSFYYLCHFLDDQWESLQALQTYDGTNLWWELGELKFESILQ